MIQIQENLSLSISGFCQTLCHAEPSRVILSVPHDGLIASDFGFFEVRDKGPDGKRAVHGHDRHVWPVVKDIVAHSNKSQVGVDAVRFLVSRTYVDANRAITIKDNLDPDTPHQTALDDPRLIPAYQNYFGVIDRLVTRSINTYGNDKVFFMDCHGFGKQPKIAPPDGFDLILGTANRTTILHDNIDRQFAEAMREFGYRVFLPEREPVTPNGDPYSAGHTTIYVANHYGINAMQIEIASRFRVREGTELGQALAGRIADFFVSRFAPA